MRNAWSLSTAVPWTAQNPAARQGNVTSLLIPDCWRIAKDPAACGRSFLQSGRRLPLRLHGKPVRSANSQREHCDRPGRRGAGRSANTAGRPQSGISTASCPAWRDTSHRPATRELVWRAVGGAQGHHVDNPKFL